MRFLLHRKHLYNIAENKKFIRIHQTTDLPVLGPFHRRQRWTG